MSPYIIGIRRTKCYLDALEPIKRPRTKICSRLQSCSDFKQLREWFICSSGLNCICERVWTGLWSDRVTHLTLTVLLHAENKNPNCHPNWLTWFFFILIADVRRQNATEEQCTVLRRAALWDFMAFSPLYLNAGKCNSLFSLFLDAPLLLKF